MRAFYTVVPTMLLIAGVAACTPKPAPIPPPPPRPIYVPPPAPPAMPLPPGGAASSTKLPAYGMDGIRITPNRGLSRDETLWHFRAAVNVAALNCQGPVWGAIAQNYNKFLVLHKARLNQANTTVDNEYRKRFPGQNALRVRDTKMTDLYNYFALPPVRQEFCNAALQKSTELLTLPTAALPEYGIGGLSDFDGIFLRFYDAYAKYQLDLADWNLKYGPKPAPAPAVTTTGGTMPVTKSKPVGR